MYSKINITVEGETISVNVPDGMPLAEAKKRLLKRFAPEGKSEVTKAAELISESLANSKPDSVDMKGFGEIAAKILTENTKQMAAIAKSLSGVTVENSVDFTDLARAMAESSRSNSNDILKLVSAIPKSPDAPNIEVVYKSPPPITGFSVDNVTQKGDGSLRGFEATFKREELH